MTLSNVNFTKSAQGGANLQPGPSKALVIGPAYGGSATKESEIYTFGSPADLYSTLGYGNASFAASLILAQSPAGYSNCDVVLAEASVAPELNEVTSSDIEISNLSDVRFDMDLRINIVTPGPRGVGRFQYTLDGITYSAPVRIPDDGQFTFPNSGVSASFDATTHTVGSGKYHARIKGPRLTSTDLANCITTLSNSNDNYTVVCVADSNDDAVSGSALFSQVDTALTSLQNTFGKYTQFMVNGGGESSFFNVPNAVSAGEQPASAINSVLEQLASQTGNFIFLSAEKWNTFLPQPFAGYSQPRLPVSFKMAAVAHGVGDDVSRPIDYGSIPGVRTPSYDERAKGEIYNNNNLAAPYTDIGEPGIKLNNSWLKSPPGSAWQYWEVGRVTNRAIEVAKAALRPYLKSNITTQAGTGYISAASKSDIEDVVNAALIAALGDPIDSFGNPGYVNIDDDGTVGVRWSIRGDTDVATSKTIQSTLELIPKTKIERINVIVSLTDSVG